MWASHQAVVAVSNITGVKMSMNYDAIPSVIFTDPEIASVGFSLEQAMEKGYDAILTQYPFQALGKALASIEAEGFASIVSDKVSKRILGAHIIGHNSSNLIAEMVFAVHNKLNIDDLTHIVQCSPYHF